MSDETSKFKMAPSDANDEETSYSYLTQFS